MSLPPLLSSPEAYAHTERASKAGQASVALEARNEGEADNLCASDPGEGLLAKAYARWKGPILRNLRRLRGGAGDSEDALHDGVLRWISARPLLQSSDQHGAYLRQIVRNVVADVNREQCAGRRLRTVPLEHVERPEFESFCDESACPVQLAANRQRLERLNEALEELPERQREAFVLCRFDELTQEEVAQRMGISRRMVVKHLSRAIAYCEVRVRYASLAQMQQIHKLEELRRTHADAGDTVGDCE